MATSGDTGGGADMLLVGGDQRTIMGCQSLRTKKHFRRAQQIDVLGPSSTLRRIT